MEIREQVLLSPYTYYKIGGPARYFAQPQEIKDLEVLSKFISEKKCKYFILGAGSNILINDLGFDGLVIHTRKINREILQTDNKTLSVGSSVMITQLLRHCVDKSLAGLDFLVGVPGSVGGVFYMNAGTKTGEVNDKVISVTSFDLEKKKLKKYLKPEIKYTYRSQHFLKPSEIIISGELEVEQGDGKEIQAKIQAHLDARKKNQPVDRPSCGSVFKNPSAKQQAWKLIDDAGLRGYRVGGAQVSEMHTNFIVNLGGATAADVKAIIDEIKRRVFKKSGINLEEEVKLI